MLQFDPEFNFFLATKKATLPPPFLQLSLSHIDYEYIDTFENIDVNIEMAILENINKYFY